MDRESSQDQRDRQDAEKAEVRKARQVRLGHVPAPKKSKPKATAKKTDE